MSELNEELLSDATDDCPDLEEAEEEALLQEDEDVLDLIPEEELQLDSTIEPSNLHVTEPKNEDLSIKTPPKPAIEEPKKAINNTPQRYNNNQSRGRNSLIQGRKKFSRNNRRIFNKPPPERNKTVLINPRFRGVVHVNNNARLAWDPQPSNIQEQSWMSTPPQIQYHIPPPPLMQPQSFHVPPPNMFQQPQAPPPPPFMGGYTHGQSVSVQNYMPPTPPLLNTSIGPPVFNQTPSFPPPNFGYRNGNHHHHHQQQQHHQGFSFEPPRQQQSPQFQSGPQTVERDLFNEKRKILNKKPLVHERLGTRQMKGPSVTIKNDNFRTPVVKEVVTVTNATTIKIEPRVEEKKEEEDEETRELRKKIEEQKRKRDEVLKWKEARRMENLQKTNEPTDIIASTKFPFASSRFHKRMPAHYNQGSGAGGGSTRQSVLHTLQTVEDSQHFAEDNDISGNNIKSFLAERKVLIKDEALLPTRKVVIKNIASSTCDKKIFQFCSNMGKVQVRNYRDYYIHRHI
ncbi:hypothetical protein ABEB36_011860 [Hypothenemus hampei]|uniref:Uncharacterized protein n=1 Tax=Hypothenemus hampei TaxID=57062 RepID=A0ABD1E9J7_HYPHA